MSRSKSTRPLLSGPLALTLGSMLLSGCERQEVASVEPLEAEAALVAGVNDEAAIANAAAQIDEAGFMQHLTTLASDEFEGRAPSTPGGRKTVEYLETQFKSLGLSAPFKGEDGESSYRQAVELVEQTVTNSPAMSLSYRDGSSGEFIYGENSVAWTTRVAETSAIQDSELVFVGYGVVAPEYGWNDYAGIDMAGKTAVILVNDPGFRAPEGELFKGNTMTYYGRWTYKYEEAARQGAAGAIIIHEDAAAGYPWEVVSGGWTGTQYMLFSEGGNSENLAVEGWISQGAAETIFAKSGMNYKDMVEQAGQPGFTPSAMGSSVSVSLENGNQRSVSYNVAAVLEGGVRPDELFIYTAHWDHMGVKPADGDKDVIFNGAQDNATGTAGILEMAQAFKALPIAPERSVMFLAVTAEESGLLGSAKYATDPAYPMADTVGGINIDALSPFGESDDIVVVGYGNSDMDNYLKVEADRQNRVLVQEPTPEKGYFYRSDHFSLAKQGVPMLYAEAGDQIRGKPEGYGAEQARIYIAERYHKAADEIHAEWDNGGIMQDLNAFFRIGVAISDSSDWPQWSEGNEFKAIREASQSDR